MQGGFFMSSKFIYSLAVLTIACGAQLNGEEEEHWVGQQEEAAIEDDDDASVASEQEPILSRVARRERARRQQAEPEPQVAVSHEEEKKPEARKKLKAHFVGSKRPAQNAPGYVPEPKVKKSTRIKNKWVSSKTHPKTSLITNRKEESSTEAESSFGEGKALASTRHFPKDGLLAQAGSDQDIPKKKKHRKEEPSEEGKEYPHLGFIAPKGTVYATSEWIYWRTRQGGMAFAVERASSTPGVFTDGAEKKLNLEWQSGFRVGLGFHLPYDGWDIYVNYTDFRPEDSASASGSIFPLLLYQGQGVIANVAEAHAHWDIDFETLDVEIGRAYYIGKSLVLRPNIGMRGAWIDQDADFHYRGGDIPAGRQAVVKSRSDFKGAGIRAGINSNWVLGAGFSFNGDLFGSLVIGHFFLSQRQMQPSGVEAIELKANLKQLTPNAQMFLGLSWDHNFYHERCHFGLTVGLESQYWWRQNQIAKFTDSNVPIYVRAAEDLAFYGINVQARLDF